MVLWFVRRAFLILLYPFVPRHSTVWSAPFTACPAHRTQATQAKSLSMSFAGNIGPQQAKQMEVRAYQYILESKHVVTIYDGKFPPFPPKVYLCNSRA